MIMRQSD